MSNASIRTEVSAADPRQLHVIIDNPSARNALTHTSAAELGAAIRAGAEDPAIRCIILRGAGDHFCAGADLRTAGQLLAGGADAIRSGISEGYHSAVRALVECPKPTLAVIRGACVGIGFDIALAADMRIAANEANLGQVFAKIGLVPDGGSSFTLARLVGLGKAMELALLAERFDGREAERIGVVNKSVPNDELDALMNDWGKRLADGPPVAYRLAKQNLRAGVGGTMAEALARETEAQVQCLQTKDAMTAARSFFLKQTPTFEGK